MHQPPDAATATVAPTERDPNIVPVFIGLMLGMMLSSSSTTIVAPALPRIVAELGRPLKPEAIMFVTDLPKTRNSKVMRRVIRARQLGLPLGDITALENPAAVDAIGEAR